MVSTDENQFPIVRIRPPASGNIPAMGPWRRFKLRKQVKNGSPEQQFLAASELASVGDDSVLQFLIYQSREPLNAEYRAIAAYSLGLIAKKNERDVNRFGVPNASYHAALAGLEEAAKSGDPNWSFAALDVMTTWLQDPISPETLLYWCPEAYARFLVRSQISVVDEQTNEELMRSMPEEFLPALKGLLAKFHSLPPEKFWDIRRVTALTADLQEIVNNPLRPMFRRRENNG